jgi:magnesium transporter
MIGRRSTWRFAVTWSESLDHLGVEELREVWPILPPEDRAAGFQLLAREDADDFFLSLSSFGQASILSELRPGERRLWMRLLAPDDAADVLHEVDPELRPELLGLLDEATRREVTALLAYEEDDAGGLMNPRFARVRPDMTVDQAISYLRRQAHDVETIYYVYVLDGEQRLQGVASFRQLFSAPGNKRMEEVMTRDVVSVADDLDQEAVARLMARHDLGALPVVDADGHMKGIVTVDDIVDVVQEEATEDIQKMGGMEALDMPYWQTDFLSMIKKRAGWLAALFLGEMLTATAMSHYEDEVARAVVLALFVPLIISSGGNSGSQATTLIIRGMALNEVKLSHWWRVARREVFAGLALGTILACIGMARILLWQLFFHTYGVHYMLVAITVAVSLVGCVTWGTLSGSLLPFVLRKLGFDPASASAPFVATLVDVVGLIIYFNVAMFVLRGTLL